MSKRKVPYIAFYTGDWKKDPKLTQCSPATRGIWIDLLCAMHDEQSGTLRGTPEELSRVARCRPEEMVAALEELKRTGTAEVRKIGNQHGGRKLDNIQHEKSAFGVLQMLHSVTSRRVTRDCNALVTRRESTRKRVQKHRLARMSSDGNTFVTKKKRYRNAVSSYSSSYALQNKTDFHPSSSDEEEEKNPSTHTHSSSARDGPPAEQAADAAVCVRGSFYSLEDCRKYAESLGDIRNPAGFAKTIFASGSDDQAISEFLANGGHRETDKEHSARIARLASELR